MHLSVYALCKIPSPRRSRSSSSGTARSRHPAGANGLPCPSPSLWQTAGGRWEPEPLTTHTEAQLWRLSDSMTNCPSVYVSLFLSLSISVTPFLRSLSLMSIFLCLSSYPCISDMSTDPCGIWFHKCHSSSTFLLRLPFTVCLFFLLPRQNL